MVNGKWSMVNGGENDQQLVVLIWYILIWAFQRIRFYLLKTPPVHAKNAILIVCGMGGFIKEKQAIIAST